MAMLTIAGNDIQTMQKLTTTESESLHQLEIIIEEGNQTFLAVGHALQEIKIDKLYRRDHSTFEIYCQARWGWGSGRAKQIISAVEIAEAIGAEASKMATNGSHFETPKTERAIRELGKTTPAKAVEVLVELKKEGVNPTALAIKAKLKEPSQVIVFDKVGHPIPTTALPLWNRETEVKDLLRKISEVRSSLRNAQASDDPLYREVTFSTAIAELDNAYGNLKTAIPHAVCYSCQGKVPDTCAFCKGKGFVSEFRYRMVPEEFKAMMGGGK